MKWFAVVLSVALGLSLAPDLPAGPAGGARAAVAAAAPPAPPAQAEPCADILLLGLAGSGETSKVTPLGSTLEVFRSSYAGRAASGGRSVEVRYAGRATQHPRVLKRTPTTTGSALTAVSAARVRAWEGDVDADVTRVVQVLDAARARCPWQQIVLAGYSQGAMAVHRALLRLQGRPLIFDRIVTAVLVADGDRRSLTAARLTGGPVAKRLGQGVHARFLPVRPDVPREGWDVAVWSVCTSSDVVCDIRSTDIATSIRVNRSYTSGASAAALRELAAWVWNRTTRFALPAPAQVLAEVGSPVSFQLPVRVLASDRDTVVWGSPSNLPPGLSLGSDGRITGTPTTAGTWTVRYTVTNKASSAFDVPVVGYVPVQVLSVSPSLALSAGGLHTCDARADQTLWCWGRNEFGQIGNGTTGNPPLSPVQVGTAKIWKDVSAGGATTCARRTSDSLWCWGLNHRGQVGDGTRTTRTRPVRVGTTFDWTGVDVGWFHTCGLRKGGTAWCWGDNSAGQLGDGTTTRRLAPVQVAGTGWTRLAVGGWHSCGLRDQGSLWCWGRNSFGELGLGDRGNRSWPTRVGTASDWADVSVSWSHTCATKASGAVWCWGRNDRGQVGDGTYRDRWLPTAVAGGRRLDSVTLGDQSSCGLDDQRTSWCWGGNDHGTFGNGSRTSSPVPVAGTTHPMRSLTAGWVHQCGVGTDAVVRCWGNGENGQLGTGSTADKTTPLGTTAARVASRAAQGRAGASYTFRLSTFNVLGDVHTRPGSHADNFAPSRIRAEWAADIIRRMRGDVIGNQELDPRQYAALNKANDGVFGSWPGMALGEPGVRSTLWWRRSVWELRAKRHITIPFIDWQRHQPVVRLRHRATGREIWVINVHNAPRDLQAQRDAAVRIEIATIKELRKSGLPVFFIGDMNEKARVFCKVLGETDLRSPLGGSHDGTRCTLPTAPMRVDWIFGSPEARFDTYAADRSALVTRTTDHAVLLSTVTVR